jgi:hypothetical protein
MTAQAIAQIPPFVEEQPPELPASRSNLATQLALQGQTLLIGDPGVSVGTGQGAFYSFSRMQDHWVYETTVTASDSGASDAFSTSIAIDADTALVGAPGIGLNGVTEIPGAAYVFVRSGAQWVEQQKLVAPDGAIDDHFGEKVALSGDIAVVSAPGKPFDANENQGAVYVFVRTGTIWAFEQQIVAPSAQAREFFGRDVALDGDTLLAGVSARIVEGALRQGVAFVFVRSGTAWQLQQTLSAPDGEASDAFGGAVALDGDTAIVCAPLADVDSYDNHGAGYVFVRVGTTWTQQQKISTTYGDSSIERFALAVALDGDTALLTAPGYHVDQGGVFVFTRSGSTWSEQQELRPSVRAMNFGFQPALSGNSAVISSIDSVYSFERLSGSGAAGSDAGSEAGDAGSSAAGDAGFDAGQPNDEPQRDASESGGCGCRLNARSAPAHEVLLLLSAACCAVRRRRARLLLQ